MKYYCIKPLAIRLANWPAQQKITPATVKAWCQEITVVARKNFPGTSRDKNYLKVVRALQEQSTPSAGYSVEEFLRKIDGIIREYGFYFTKARHAVAFKNIVQPGAEDRPLPDNNYDLAFYHPARPINIFGHHNKDIYRSAAPDFISTYRGEIQDYLKKAETAPPSHLAEVLKYIARQRRHLAELAEKVNIKSLFYFRCEEFHNQLLVGNMQIDLREPLSGSGEEELAPLHSPRNIQTLMVQEAVKHALAAGKEKIIFQGGAAVELAQWYYRKEPRHRVLITEKNLSEYREKHAQLQEEYMQRRIGAIVELPTGEKLIRVRRTSSGEHYYPLAHAYLIPLVYNLTAAQNLPAPSAVARTSVPTPSAQKHKKSPEIHEETPTLLSPVLSVHTHPHLNKLRRLIDLNKYLLREENAPEFALRLRHLSLYCAAREYYNRDNFPELGRVLAQIFNYGPEVPPPASPAQENFLRQLKSTAAPTEALYKTLEPYLVKFGYAAALQKRFSQVKKINMPSGVVRFYANDGRLIARPNLAKPEVNDLVPANYKLPGFPTGHDRIYQWYEKTLLKIFKKLNLSYRRVPIYGWRKNHAGAVEGDNPRERIMVTGWEITTPKEELQTRALTVF